MSNVEPVTLELIDAAIGYAIGRDADIDLIHDYLDMRHAHIGVMA
jgi:hypothetical protein